MAFEVNHSFNPSHPGLETERYCDPSVLVIFGASGNLTKRKLMPALFKLYTNGFIPEGSKIIGLSRAYRDHYNFRDEMKKAIQEFGSDDQKGNLDWTEFSGMLYYISADFGDDGSYEKLKDEMMKLESTGETCGNRLFYLATPPQFFNVIIDNLGKHGLNHPLNEGCWTRIIVEKPFGHNLESAQKLDRKIGKVFKENQIYRIDHYLGKETVQNLLVFRFGNSIFEPIWNRNYIDHVQITAAETIGLEGRADYYDKAGALRDMVPNHLFQLLAMIAMEPPVTFEPDIVRDEKVQVFHAIPPITPEDARKFTVRGQYSAGVINGKKVIGYLDEDGVAPGSRTETFAALKLYIQNWRWAGVPFYIRTGKRMPKFVTDITLVFKKTPHMIFRMMSQDVSDSNILSIQIQPDESIMLSFNAKIPGAGMKIKPVAMDFDYFTAFGTRPTNAYERLIRDCLSGDQTLYARRDGVEASWAIIDSIMDYWDNEKEAEVPKYNSGTWGPNAADKLLEQDGKKWKIL